MSATIRLLSLLLLSAGLVVLVEFPAWAGCDAAGDLDEATVACYYNGDEIKSISHSDPSYRWTVKPVCKTESQSGTCFNPVVCGSGAGVLYAVYRIQLPSGPRELYGYACLTDQEAADLGAITPAMVFTAMQGLTWPTSELVVQPPGGETLVNLETNFYTTNVEPTTQTVTLLGQQVEIEATPGRYVWHWAGAGEADNAQDTGSMTSESPGAAYPNLAVTHTYRDAKITVHRGSTPSTPAAIGSMATAGRRSRRPSPSPASRSPSESLRHIRCWSAEPWDVIQLGRSGDQAV